MGVLGTARAGFLNKKSRHVALRHMAIHDHAGSLFWVPGVLNPSDFFTKSTKESPSQILTNRFDAFGFATQFVPPPAPHIQYRSNVGTPYECKNPYWH